MIKEGKMYNRMICRAVLLLSMLVFIGTAAAGVVSVIPQSKNVAPGATFSVNVNVDSGSDNLQAAHVELNFDTSVLTATAFTKGTLLGSPILEEPGIGIGTGKVTYGASRTTGNPSVPVNGTFFTVQFQVKSNIPAGVSVLDLVNVNLKKDPENSIPNPVVNDGQVRIVREAKVSVSPVSQDSSPGGVFSVNVNINSETNSLQAAHVELNYDTSVLIADSFTSGNLLGASVLTEPGTGISPGKITLGVARNGANTAVPVNGMFFTVQFHVKTSAMSGNSNLNLVNVVLKDSPTSNIPDTILQNGTVNVISCLGDFSGDGKINFDDFVIFAAAYGTSTGNPNFNPDADMNHDGKVNFDDFVIFASVYGTSCKG